MQRTFYNFSLLSRKLSLKPYPMNAMRILICATFTIIVAALVYTFVKQDNEPTLAELRQELAEAQRKKQQDSSFTSFNYPTEPTAIPTPSMSDLEAQLAAEKDNAAEPEALTPEQITALANEAEAQSLEESALDSELAQPAEGDDRAMLIKEAHAMAQVNHYDSTQQIIIVDLKRPESIVMGQILGIRRNNGILGRVKLAGKVTSNPNQAFADPVIPSFFNGKVDIQVGDELIIVP